MAEVRHSPTRYLEQQVAYSMASFPLRSFKMCCLWQFPQHTSTPLEEFCTMNMNIPFLCFKPLGPFLLQRCTVLKPSRLQDLDSHLPVWEENPLYATINGMKWIEVRTRTFCVSGANLYMLNGSSQTNDLLEREPADQVCP